MYDIRKSSVTIHQKSCNRNGIYYQTALQNLQTAAIVDNILKLLPFDDTLSSLFSCHFIKILVV